MEGELFITEWGNFTTKNRGKSFPKLLFRSKISSLRAGFHREYDPTQNWMKFPQTKNGIPRFGEDAGVLVGKAECDFQQTRKDC